MRGAFVGKKLLKENKGKSDVDLAEKMLGDHVDSYHQKPETNERTLCGHVDSSPRGVDVWGWRPFYPGGAVQAKATDSTMTKEMKMMARVGHPCGEDFLAKPFLAAHPQYGWQASFLQDMKEGPVDRVSIRRNGTAGKTIIIPGCELT